MLKLGWVTTTPSFFWLGWAIVQSSYYPQFFFFIRLNQARVLIRSSYVLWLTLIYYLLLLITIHKE